MSCPDNLCNAGLFHSFYGTEFFDPKLEVNRLELVNIIGYKAEQIVYDFCQLKNRDEFLLKNIHNHKDLFFINLANLGIYSLKIFNLDFISGIFETLFKSSSKILSRLTRSSLLKKKSIILE